MTLWHMEFKVEGKNLEKCLAALTGIALDMQVPRLVTNAVVQKGGTVKQALPGVTQTSRLKMYLQGHGVFSGQQISSSMIRDGMIELSIPKNNYNSMIQQLKKQEYLKTTDKRGSLLIL